MPACLQVVRDDPLAYKETGDEYAKHPGQKPWIAGGRGKGGGSGLAGWAPGASPQAAAGQWPGSKPPYLLAPTHVRASRPAHLGGLQRCTATRLALPRRACGTE